MYHVKVRGGYLWRGKVVASLDKATTYTSLSAAERGLQQAVARSVVTAGRVVEATAVERGSDATAARRQASAKARLEEAGGKRIPVKLFARQVKKLEALLQSGFAVDQQAAIRRLIDEKNI